MRPEMTVRRVAFVGRLMRRKIEPFTIIRHHLLRRLIAFQGHAPRGGTMRTGMKTMLLSLTVAAGGFACTTDATQTGEPATVAPTTAESTPSATLVRLSNREYDNAVQDLLGVPGVAETTFPTDSVATLGDDHFQQYFDAADA